MRKKQEKTMQFLSVKSLTTAAIVTLLCSSIANATVETGWVVGTPNTCRNSTDIFIDFEGGIDTTEVKSSNPSLEFTNTSGLDWQYLDFTTGKYNTSYIMNGDTTTWLGVTGNTGRITFKGGTGSYLSLLTKTYSGLEMDAYDANGNHLANSGRAGDNLSTGTMTRLTVEADNISYVEIHDSGNYWTVDDICTDAAPVCQPLPGHTNGDSDERIDLVFVMDEDYNGNLEAFLSDAQSKVNNRLGGVAPVDTNLDKFNFYFTRQEGTVDTNNCGQENSLPDDLLKQCPFADAVVVLHTASFGDCKRTSGGVSIFSAEGNSNRSFIHEAGHGLFGLRDEYDSDREMGSCSYTAYTSYWWPFHCLDTPSDSNIWATEEDCRNEATNQGWDPDRCYEFTECQCGWWKHGDPSLASDDDRYYDNAFQFIMNDGVYFSNGFGDASERAINLVFDGLAPSGTTGGSEKSIILNYNINETGELQLLETSYTLAKSPSYYLKNNNFRAKVFLNNGALIGNYSFNDPRLVEAEYDYSGPSTLDSANFQLILPLSSSIEKAEIVEESTGEVVATANLDSYATKQAVEGDLNDDGIVDRNDVTIINDYRNQPASENPGCDIDKDGTITIYDARMLMTMCTYPRCSSN